MQTLKWDTASLSSTTLHTVGLLERCLLTLSSTISFLFFPGFWNINKGGETTGCSVVGQRDRTDCLLKVSGPRHSTRLCSVSLFCLHFATFSWQIHHLSKTSSLPSLSLSVYSPSPAPLHPGKWLYPVEWLCKDVGTGFKLSPAKGKDARGKIKKEEAEKKDSLEFFSPGAKCPCLMQKDESSPCSICERPGGPNSTRGEILSLLWNSCCCRRIQRHLNLRSLCKCHPQGHSRHDDVSECLMSRSPSAADWRGLPLHMHASPRVPDGGCSEGGRHVA